MLVDSVCVSYCSSNRLFVIELSGCLGSFTFIGFIGVRTIIYSAASCRLMAYWRRCINFFAVLSLLSDIIVQSSVISIGLGSTNTGGLLLATATRMVSCTASTVWNTWDLYRCHSYTIVSNS